jgi:hypothetical protein
MIVYTGTMPPPGAALEQLVAAGIPIFTLFARSLVNRKVSNCCCDVFSFNLGMPYPISQIKTKNDNRATTV